MGHGRHSEKEAKKRTQTCSLFSLTVGKREKQEGTGNGYDRDNTSSVSVELEDETCRIHYSNRNHEMDNGEKYNERVIMIGREG